MCNKYELCKYSSREKLNDGEIEALKKAGIDVHEYKVGQAREDLYKDKDGNIIAKPKGGGGEGEPTGLNINDY